MDIKGLLQIRLQVLQQVIPSGEEPIDITFSVIGTSISMAPVDMQGDFPPSRKYKARKEVCNYILSRTIPELRSASEVVYFSFDPILNVDYCFEIMPASHRINLYVYSSKGDKICTFVPYDIKSDERTEIERAKKSSGEHTSAFSSLKEKFSRLLGHKKSDNLEIVRSINPIIIDVKDEKPQKSTVESAPASTKAPSQSTFVNETLSRLDNEKFKAVRAAGIGFGAISISLSSFTDQMASLYPEWNGLFEFAAEKDHVRVTCLKGFDDEITSQAIPYLWKRKSFIENCIILGVEKIVFLDPISSTFDLLKVSEVNPAILAE